MMATRVSWRCTVPDPAPQEAVLWPTQVRQAVSCYVMLRRVKTCKSELTISHWQASWHIPNVTLTARAHCQRCISPARRGHPTRRGDVCMASRTLLALEGLRWRAFNLSTSWGTAKASELSFIQHSGRVVELTDRRHRFMIDSGDHGLVPKACRSYAQNLRMSESEAEALLFPAARQEGGREFYSIRRQCRMNVNVIGL